MCQIKKYIAFIIKQENSSDQVELVIVFSEKTDVPNWIYSFSTTVTLNIRSGSPTSNQFFVVSRLYIHENLVRIQQLVHKILCRQESHVNAKATEFSVFYCCDLEN